MTGHILRALALLAVVGAGGTVWLLVRDERGRSRRSSARVLRITTTVSALVVLGTLAFLHPWYWDLAIAVGVVVASLSFDVVLRRLENRGSPASWGAIGSALVSVVLGSALVMVGATAAVIDGASLLGSDAIPVVHDHQVLAHPVLYQVFWGPAWDDHGPTPALAASRLLPAGPAQLAMGVGDGEVGVRRRVVALGRLLGRPEHAPLRRAGVEHGIGTLP